MKIVVAVTAASGALYARLCLEQLLRAEEVSEIALVYSAHAREVADFEGVTLPEDPRIRISTTTICSLLRPAVRPITTRWRSFPVRSEPWDASPAAFRKA